MRCLTDAMAGTPGRRSITAGGPWIHEPEGLFLVAFHGRGSLALSDLCGFLVEFAFVDFRKDPCLFTGAFEAAPGDIEGFIVSYFYKWHIGAFLQSVLRLRKRCNSSGRSRKCNGLIAIFH